MFRESNEYCDKTLEIASKHVDEMQADMGGTYLLDPLIAVLNKPTSLVRQLFILTDGILYMKFR